MKRLLLVACAVALVAADASAFGRRQPVRAIVRGLLGQPASCGGCAQQAGPVQYAQSGPIQTMAGTALTRTGALFQHTGNLILKTQPTCVNGACR